MDPYHLCSKTFFTLSDALVIAGIIVLLLFSAFFSACETAFSSANALRIRNFADEKRKGARRAVYIIDNFESTLSTILVGNNLANIASTTLCAYIFGKFIVNPTLSNIINTLVMTIIVLIFGEIMPKSLAKMNPEKVALRFSNILYVVSKILFPLTICFVGIQKLLKKKNKSDLTPTVTEDELESIIDTMEEEGVIDSDNADLIQSVIDMDSTIVEDIMIPRVDVVAVDILATEKEIEDLYIEHNFSRMPVYEDDKDNIVGVINQKDYFMAVLQKKKVDIKSLMTEPLYVSPTMKIDDLMRKMQSAKIMLAIVVDEYGGTAGIVTMEDVLEEMVGEIYDEHDDEELAEFVENKDGSYSLDPDISVEDLFDKLEIENLPETKYSSVGGMIIELAQELPQEGSSYHITAIDDVLDEHNNYVKKIATLTFTVQKVEDRRIIRILLQVERKDLSE